MKGIENIKIVLLWALLFAIDVKKSKEDDGKITIKDAPRFADNIMKAPAAIKAAPEVLQEALDLDGEEAEEIAQLVIDTTGVPREGVKTVIRKAMAAVVSYSHAVKDTLDLAEAIKALKNGNEDLIDG